MFDLKYDLACIAYNAFKGLFTLVVTAGTGVQGLHKIPPQPGVLAGHTDGLALMSSIGICSCMLEFFYISFIPAIKT